MNILEIIKKAPKDHVYYCTVLGECRCSGNDDDKYPISCDILSDADGKTLSFLTKDGKYFENTPDSECILFPSRDNRDWEAFERELDEVNDNDSRFNPPAYGTDSYKDGVSSGYCKMEDMIGINLDHEFYKEHPYVNFHIDGKEYKVFIEDMKRLAMNSTKDIKERFCVVDSDKHSIDIEDKEKDVSGKSFFDNTFDGTADMVSIPDRPDRPMIAAVICAGLLAGGCKDKGAALVNKALHLADLILDETETKTKEE